MSWKQVKSFNVKKMGTKSGLCLKNVCDGYGITGATFPSAKADMEYQKKHGTLHPYSSLSSNVAVPVYLDTASKYEHVEVCDHGTWYSDGKKVRSPNARYVFGWGECCGGARVVEWVEDKKGFLPAKGYWCYGDKDERIGKMAEFMYKTFPAYTNKKALGNYFGNYLKSSIKEFQRRTGLEVDGMVGKKTYAMLKKYGFKY